MHDGTKFIPLIGKHFLLQAQQILVQLTHFILSFSVLGKVKSLKPNVIWWAMPSLAPVNELIANRFAALLILIVFLKLKFLF